MAEGFLKSFDSNIEVFSAGTKPSTNVHPNAIRVMKEIGIDLSNNFPKNVSQFLCESFDYVITVCNSAKESCPIFVGKVKHRLHIGFEDPAEASGTEEDIVAVFRKVRDEIKASIFEFYKSINKRG
jgi:arsenate reductase (thioredoxin)